MKQPLLVFYLVAAAFLLAACGSPASDGVAAGTADAPTPIEPKIDDDMNLTAKPQGPVRFSYRVIGTPVVGQPVTIDLVVESNVGDVPITLNYASNDTTAMTFPETQVREVSVGFVDDERLSSQQVTVVPAREGRLFLNVSATLQLESGTMQTAHAIPLQVGAAPRDLTPDVPATTDAEGNQLREMPAD
jgi:hypothetical protein